MNDDDPGYLPDAERCPAGGPHTYEDNLTAAQLLTGIRPRDGVRVWCSECGAPATTTEGN